MDSHGRAGARRLIDWTGERCVPWASDVQVVYEHYHRYLWAASWAKGKRVLDLASGEGFGAAILSEVAREVVGVDIDPTSVEHASLRYTAEALSFQLADARDLGAFDDASFDLIVAFEMIEHVEEQATVLKEIKRVLTPDGLLIMSTPDRVAYDELSDEGNPYHLRELSRDEFTALLAAHFANQALWLQHVASGSAMVLAEAADHAGSEVAGVESLNFMIERDHDGWRPTARLPLIYMVALASNAQLEIGHDASALSDAGLALIQERLDSLASELNAEIDRRGEEIEARGIAIRTSDAQTASARAQLRRRDGEYEKLAIEYARARDSFRLRLQEQDQLRLRDRDQLTHALQGRLEGLEFELQLVRTSVSWKIFQRVRGTLFWVLGGESSVAARALRRSVPLIRRLRRTRSDARTTGDVTPEVEHADLEYPVEPRRPEFDTIEFPEEPAPFVSIVMPLYAGAELTYRALKSILAETSYTPYEVILVDDGHDEDTKRLLAHVKGARTFTNERNLGYLQSIKYGVGLARGKWLVLCNNDIEVRPGWLAELLSCGESADDVGIVTPKYLTPDGRISEAGGIIWRDGTGANYGRGDSPDSWRYQYRREVDYGSAAALLVRATAWRDAGGFDERFEPMYFEDTDLCFTARSLGYRVMYEPRAEVVHAEGSTAGVDESEGHKRFQARNRPVFVEKWRHVLNAEHLDPPESDADLWLGATNRYRKRVAIVDHRIPLWDRESGALRQMGILRALRAEEYHVTFVPDNGLAMEPYTSQLRTMGVAVMNEPAMREEFAEIAQHLDGAIVSRPNVATRWLPVLRAQAPDAVVAYDTVDLHWVREGRQAARELDHEDDICITPAVAWTRELELALVRATDLTLVVTERERERVLDDAPHADVLVVPNVHDIMPDVPGPSARRWVIFVGGFEHPPNVDAACALVEEVMPLVWQRHPGTGVKIVGPDPPARVEALASETVEVVGWVPDLEPLLSTARALVAPLTYGAGMKGKVTQAMAAGLPVVTTPVGAEGLDAVDGDQLLVGANAEELADRVSRVLSDDTLWLGLSEAGQDLVDRMCSPDQITDALRQIFERPVPSAGEGDPNGGGPR